MKSPVTIAMILILCAGSAAAQTMQRTTYCNPLNIDYTYMIYNAYNNISYRSGADPAVMQKKAGSIWPAYKNERYYYILVTV